MQKRTMTHLDKAIKIKDKILYEYSELLNHPRRKHFVQILNGINEETIYAVSFRRPNWNSTYQLQELTTLFKELKENISMIQKRDYLSITPKIEDIKVVYRWVELFNVPHYYFQVFFDKSYAVSFKNILLLMTEDEKEGEYYEISKDVKNQNKTTIKINTKKTKQIAYRITEPRHKSKRREMGRGRLLFYVTFDKWTAYLDVENLKSLLSIKDF